MPDAACGVVACTFVAPILPRVLSPRFQTGTTTGQRQPDADSGGTHVDILLLVDLQHDFLPGGALPVIDGDQVIAVANRLQPHFTETLATQDWHPRDHASFAANQPGRRIGEVIDLDGLSQILWPVHCVQESTGAAFASQLDTKRIRRIFPKGTDPRIDSYSGFFDNGGKQATGLSEYLQQRAVRQLFVMGLATDYCVQFTVLDALQLGFDTALVVDGCRGVNQHPGDSDTAIQAMTAAGVTVMSSEQVMRSRQQA